jgi:SAM-dependent methyltransferase
MKTSKDKLADARRCPICGATPLFAFEAKYVQVLKCSEPDCGHIYAASSKPLHGIQQHIDPEEECRKYAHRNVGLVAFLARVKFINPKSRILDVGAGVGHVAMAIRNAFPNTRITCVEADPDAKAWLSRHGFETADKLEDCTGPYDSIYMIEVIEHVDDPIAVLKTLRELLATEGRLFITTPCGQATSGRMVSDAFETPEHVHFFTENSLRRALLAAGFEAPRFRTLRHMYHIRRGLSVATDAIKDVARFVRAKLLGQHQLITVVGRQNFSR